VPTNLKAAAAYLKKNPGSRLIAGGSDLCVVHNKRKQRLSKTVSLHLIPELYQIKKKGSKLEVGARVTLSELRDAVKASVPEFARFLDLFASPQIKNVATLVGNLANASPIADMPPFLLVSNAVNSVVGPRGKRKIPIEKFFLGYRSIALKPGELITSVEFELLPKSETLALYKVSQRKDLDISGVNAAFRACFKRVGGKCVIDRMSIVLGGVAATPVRLPKTEASLKGMVLGAEVLAQACQILQKEIAPISDLRGSQAFRRVVAENLLRRFFRERAPE